MISHLFQACFLFIVCFKMLYLVLILLLVQVSRRNVVNYEIQNVVFLSQSLFRKYKTIFLKVIILLKRYRFQEMSLFFMVFLVINMHSMYNTP